MTEGLFNQLAGTGVVGVMLVLALLALRAKDKELREVREASAKETSTEKQLRIDDAKQYLTLAMSLQKEVIHAVQTLGEIMEILRKELKEAQGENEET